MSESIPDRHPLARVDHLAVQVGNVRRAVNWYRQQRDVEVIYQDDDWALLHLDEINLAVMLPVPRAADGPDRGAQP
jgi:hypothetical protein